MKPSPDAAAGVPFPPDGDRAPAAPSFPGSPGRRLPGDPAMPPQTPSPHDQQSPTGQTPAQQVPDEPDRIDAESLSNETRPVPRDRGPVGPEVPGPATAAQTPAPPATGAEDDAGTPQVEDGETQDIRFTPGEATAQLPPPTADADQHTGVLPSVTDGPDDVPEGTRATGDGSDGPDGSPRTHRPLWRRPAVVAPVAAV